ncbi:TIGR03086 family metal-binding protein [Mycolicibacter arupensis]|uniref:TIGR03086 family protein n=1 Tax=Mycolicibacter arupensis TaxID=342002 RepID=A0A0F5MWV9_9MYCO|nr:TIGR03086 family metal-binding protein [Mycolicibacter arupensis]KAA1430097.1 TIGR03086 family protein [Mycolicibacter arupensis]KKB99288.1 transcriptional regulator, ArsR family protein [Mycolicibacter arupensis]MCV7275165.1 TIGR03086 family protein [Mycolicibacter arupensis]OQZ97764.1 TIGR03086 family protein [Mycolicibacter arupensis]TXI47984.1 MAG: TIGR03086 family protein [Mycolicibacter arupensis]
MPSEMRPSPDEPPADELAAAEAGWAVLEQVLGGITSDEWSNQTPCSEFDVAQLTDHLLHSLTVLGGAAGAQIPPREAGDAVLRQVTAAARPALDAWHSRGLDGAVTIGPAELPARVAAGILSLEFLVHAWDYATATDRAVNVSEPLADYVHSLARRIITPEGRVRAGFDDPVDVPDSASSLDRLLAFTGRS